MLITRRSFTLGLFAVPLVWMPGCGRPKTPLSHLYGPAWVSGAYEQYGQTYSTLQKDSEDLSFQAYGVLAQKGVTALDKLQLREVPFHIRVDDAAHHFAIERDVPERLTFKADMSEADRETATKAWETAREHIHTDYEECRRLEWALTRLLAQLQRIRGAIENTRDEQFRLTRQVTEVHAGTLPFELPYQVSKRDYELVLVLLIERLEDDRKRLEAVESAIVTVGLTVRATDARSASLAANIRKVLVAVVDDATASSPRPVAWPKSEEERAGLEAGGRKLIAKILKSEEYAEWQKRERDAALDQIGALLTILDSMTGLPTSKVYKTVMGIWRGNGDYLEYLKLAAGLVPQGSALSKTLGDATALTDKVRKVKDTGERAVAGAKNGGAEALVNTGTSYAKKNVSKQLVFFHDQDEADGITEKLGETSLMKNALPAIPSR